MTCFFIPSRGHSCLLCEHYTAAESTNDVVAMFNSFVVPAEYKLLHVSISTETWMVLSPDIHGVEAKGHESRADIAKCQ